jgi:hypothetical protein
MSRKECGNFLIITYLIKEMNIIGIKLNYNMPHTKLTR